MVQVADEFTMALASALAGQAAEAVADGTKAAWNALVRLVRERFARDGTAAVALDAAQAQPEDQVAVYELSRALERVAAGDSRFAEQVQLLWPLACKELSAGGGVVNVTTGTVSGHLIQARDLRVEGGLRLGDVKNPGA